MSDSIRALLLLILANSAPWAAGRVFGHQWSAPLDGGWTLPDGSRVLGDHKTWRGLFAGTASCALAAPLLGLEWMVGALFGALSLAGDALSSSIKRRLALKPGAEAPGLDQLPEALLPLLVLGPQLGLELGPAAAVTFTFMTLNLLMVRVRR